MRALVLLVGVAACDRTPARVEPTPQPPPKPAAEAPRDELIAKLECTRCHEIPNNPSAVRDKHCIRCHQEIHDGTFDAKPEAIAKWRGRIHSLRDVPSLASASRLRRSWVKQFLLAPHDIRPGSIAQMPRLAITDAQATRLAEILVPTETDAAIPRTPADEAWGEQLYVQLACARCHRFTGARVDDPEAHAGGRITEEQRRTSPELAQQAIGWTLAPDLRFARERVQPAQLARWIERPGGAMPVIAGIGNPEAAALAAFITYAPLAPVPEPGVPQRLPVLARPVVWAEVADKVFRDTCWHCHAVPDFARGDGGPGNSGGFGFAPRGLDLSSYTGISQGSFDTDGERRSIFQKIDGVPRVVAHLMARHIEAAGGAVDNVRGMPLGLPPLTLEQIQLVESWIAQGRPQ